MSIVSLLTASTIWLLGVSSLEGPIQSPEQLPDTVELVRLEVVWNQAHIAGDVDALDRLWATDVVVTVPGMTPMYKPELLAFSRSGRMRFERYETSEVQVRVYGDAAVVTGRLFRTRMLGGRTAEDRWRFTKVYVRRARSWQVVSFHASELGP